MFGQKPFVKLKIISKFERNYFCLLSNMSRKLYICCKVYVSFLIFVFFSPPSPPKDDDDRSKKRSDSSDSEKTRNWNGKRSFSE
jgi:hypothetical protein